jgi:hypothetical protein
MKTQQRFRLLTVGLVGIHPTNLDLKRCPTIHVTTTNNENDDTKKIDDDDDVPKLPFVTTSDVLNQLNKGLQDLSKGEEDVWKPRFELQKRLPYGSTIPANDKYWPTAICKPNCNNRRPFVRQTTVSESRPCPHRLIRTALGSRKAQTNFHSSESLSGNRTHVD